MRMHGPDYKIILCDVINPLSDQKAFLGRRQAVVLKRFELPSRPVRESVYLVQAVVPESELLSRRMPFLSGEAELLEARGLIALPAFYDMHFHWVQDDVREMPKDSLLTWLSHYTWPHEKKFQSKAYTSKKAREFSQHLLQCGTLGGGCYGSLHGHSVDAALEHFVGDFVVGNVLMAMNSPKYLSQSSHNALELVAQKSKKYGPRYALTPRFAPTTPPDVMREGAKLAKKHGSFIQSHLAETQEEIDYVLSLFHKLKGFEKVKSYTEIYAKCGILGPKTIMGHGIHLSAAELRLLKKTKTAIAHCPTSNAPVKQLGLGSGLFDWKRIHKAGVRWALASDIGGGPYLSMLDVMQSFVAQNRRAKKSASYTQALFRSTLAGADILGLARHRGNLEPGKAANFVLLESPLERKGEDAESVLAKLISRHAKDRSRYRSMVHSTFYHGHELYRAP